MTDDEFFYLREIIFMVKEQNKVYQVFLNFLIAVIGCFMFSYAYYGFIIPNEIAVGGMGGIASAISSSYGVKMGTLMISMNTPLLILAWIFLGKRFAIDTTLVIIGSKVMMDYIVSFLPQFKGQPFLKAIYGGLLLGFGISLIFTRGFTTGGTDIIGRLIQLKFPSVSIGNLLMIFDVTIICIASYIYTLGGSAGDWKRSAIYGVVAVFIYTKTIDVVLAGFNKMKAMYMISDKCN